MHRQLILRRRHGLGQIKASGDDDGFWKNGVHEYATMNRTIHVQLCVVACICADFVYQSVALLSKPKPLQITVHHSTIAMDEDIDDAIEEVMARTRGPMARTRRGHSQLFLQLMSMLAWGTLSGPQIQVISQCAWQDGALHSDVQAMASIGASGAWAGNTRRDLLRLVHRNFPLQVPNL